MKDKEKTAIILSLTKSLQEKGSWCGQTHIHKAVYFLQQLKKVPLEFNFILYKHGPYSHELKEKFSIMNVYSMFEQHLNEPYGPSYFVSEKGDQIINENSKFLNKYEKEIDFTAELLKDKGIADLERLSTALYVIKKSENKNENNLAEQINKYKPHINLDEALKAINSVKKLLPIILLFVFILVIDNFRFNK